MLKFKELALIGLTSGTLLATEFDPLPLMRADLDHKTEALYYSMGQEGQTLVRKLLFQDCKGQNDCKGLNACKTEDQNTCAGRCKCQGQSAGPFQDKALAVKVAAKKLAEKRLEKTFAPLEIEPKE